MFKYLFKPYKFILYSLHRTSKKLTPKIVAKLSANAIVTQFLKQIII
jgi:hypothetical protein